MIDWLTLNLPVDRPLQTGSIASVLPSGEIEWIAPKKLNLEPESWRANTQVWCRNGRLWLSGNPAKWLNGHNWHGSEDVQTIAREWVYSVLMQLDHDWHRIGSENWELTRIDLTRSFDFGTNDEVNRMIQALEKAATLTHRGRGRFPTAQGRNTLYFGQNSRRWALKLYNKWEEQKAQGELTNAVLNGVAREGLLRVELVLRQMELKDKFLHRLEAWNSEVVDMVYNSYLDKLEISEQAISSPMMVLPPRLYGVYEMWKRGVLLKESMGRRTWYRARKDLLAYGVDISSEPLKVEAVEDVVYTVPQLSRWSLIPDPQKPTSYARMLS